VAWKFLLFNELEQTRASFAFCGTFPEHASVGFVLGILPANLKQYEVCHTGACWHRRKLVILPVAARRL
jgi:hypothetical protein